MSMVVIACNILYLSTIKLQRFSLLTKFTVYDNSLNSRF